MEDVRSPSQWHFCSDLAQQLVINCCGSNLGLIALVANVGEHSAPRINDHAVTVADSLLVVPSCLGGGNHV